jgi:hypothetical protein
MERRYQKAAKKYKTKTKKNKRNRRKMKNTMNNLRKDGPTTKQNVSLNEKES